jgi:hypothetical protein
MQARYVFIMACGNPIVGSWTSVDEDALRKMHTSAIGAVQAPEGYFEFSTQQGHQVFLSIEAIRQGALVVEIEVDGGKN